MSWYFWVPWLMLLVGVKRHDRHFIVNDIKDYPACAKRFRREFRRLAVWFVISVLAGLGVGVMLTDTSWPIRIIPILMFLMVYGLVAHIYFTTTAERHKRDSPELRAD